jgi:hypothetical protein
MGLSDRGFDDWFFAIVFGVVGWLLTDAAFQWRFPVLGWILLVATVFLVWLCLTNTA